MNMETTATTIEKETSVKAMDVKAFGTTAADHALGEINIGRRRPTAHDVEIEILYCGVCHSDLHTVRNEWHGTIYPCIPGHEIVGRVRSTGADVTKFKA